MDTMASGGPSFPCDQPGEPNSNLNPLQEGGNSSGTVNETVVQPLPTRFLPIANVQRIMRRILPTHAKISNESKEFMVECAADFISFITGEANHHCQLEHRRTITAEDAIDTMRRLSFDQYADVLARFLQRYRQNACDAREGQHVPLPPLIPFAPYDGVPVAPPPPPPTTFSAPNLFLDPMEMGGFIGDEASGSSGGHSSSASFDPRDNTFGN